MKSYEITLFRITIVSYVAIKVIRWYNPIWDVTMGTNGNYLQMNSSHIDTIWYPIIDLSRYVKIFLWVSTQNIYIGFLPQNTVPYSTIEYHRVPPKIPTRKICKSSNDVLRFFPNEHIAISNSATVASRPSRPSRPCLGSRKISWIFGSNLWIVYRNEPQNSMNFRCSFPAKNSGKNQCDVSTGNMFTFQANRITGVITSNSRSHWWSPLCAGRRQGRWQGRW